MLPDITTQKVAIPAALFLALSPGMVLTTDGSKVKFMNRQTDQMSIFFHALVFFLAYSLVAKAMGIVLTQTDLIVTTALFITLSPGLLLTLPQGSGGVFQSGQTSVESTMIHTIVYAVIFALLRRQFPQFY
jgi:hypothetical protein